MIRTKAVADEGGALSADQRLANQAAIDAAVAQVRRLSSESIEGRRLFDGSADYRVSGRNNQQLAKVEVHSLGATTSLQGEVVEAATRAELTYTGTDGEVDTGDATFTVSSNRGSASISVTDEQTLASVAAAINAESHNTGVTASVDGDALTFASVDYGYRTEIQVEATAGTFAVSGGNDGDNDSGTARGTDATVVINGRRIEGNREAAAAELKHYRSTGTITFNTQFTLTGNRGNATIVLSAGDTLADAAGAINDETAATGVTASVSQDGKTLTIASEHIGADQHVEVELVSGTFLITGGNSDGTASGADAVENPNVDGNRVTFVDNRTNVRLELAAGFVGDIDEIEISDGGKLSFALSPDVGTTTSLALPSLGPELLGGVSGVLADLTSGGSASGLAANASQAIRIVDEALGDLDRTSGRVDGFAEAAVASSSELLSNWSEDLEDSIYQINGIDEAAEEQLQAHYLALSDNALSGLAILNQQRAGIVEILRQAAGLD